VNPPDSSYAVTPEDEPIVVTLTKAGDSYIQNQKVALTDLESALAAQLDRTASKAVAIRGDESVSLGRLVEVMDMARGAGAEKLAIATERKTGRRP
jgi:biopolymer transport protein ExbD